MIGLLVSVECVETMVEGVGRIVPCVWLFFAGLSAFVEDVAKIV